MSGTIFEFRTRRLMLNYTRSGITQILHPRCCLAARVEVQSVDGQVLRKTDPFRHAGNRTRDRFG